MSSTRPLALITGASSGIGAELAVEFARRGYDLLLTARDAGRLAETAGRVAAAGASADTLPHDLGAEGGVAGLLAWVADRPVDVLVNNAGFGGSAKVAEADPAYLASMIHLNVTILTLLTQAFTPGMIRRGRGRILNVASTAAFSPVPTMATYGATKAYVLSFTAALSAELAGTGVTATALCPGATHTRFADRASVGKSGAFARAMSAEAVARQGVDALLKGKGIRINGLSNQLMAFSTRLAPRALAAKIAGRLMA